MTNEANQAPTFNSLKPWHHCRPLARAVMAANRDWWIGELLHPVPEWPTETHCLHMKTPVKDVVFLCNSGDFEQLIVIANAVMGLKNLAWLESMTEGAKSRVSGLTTEEEALVIGAIPLQALPAPQPAASEAIRAAAIEIVKKISDAALELAFTRHELTTTEYEDSEYADIEEGVEAFKELVEEVKADVLANLVGDDTGCLDPEDVDYDNELEWTVRAITKHLAAAPADENPLCPVHKSLDDRGQLEVPIGGRPFYRVTRTPNIEAVQSITLAAEKEMN